LGAGQIVSAQYIQEFPFWKSHFLCNLAALHIEFLPSRRRRRSLSLQCADVPRCCRTENFFKLSATHTKLVSKAFAFNDSPLKTLG
jgi:hypothetical protein